MASLFQKCWNFASQELKSRAGFWYKICAVVYAKVFALSLILISAIVASGVFAWNLQASVQSSLLLMVLLWGIVFAIIAICMYYLIKKFTELITNLMLTSFAAAQGEQPEKIQKISNVTPFIQTMFYFMIIFGFIALVKKIIMDVSGSVFLGTLFLISLTLLVAIRLHFVYFFLFKKLQKSKVSFFQVYGCLKDSFELTKGKFSQLFFIFVFFQSFSIIIQLLDVLRLQNVIEVSVLGLMYLVLTIFGLAITPLVMLMHARAYVVLTQEK